MMEAAAAAPLEESENFYKNARRYDPDDRQLQYY
jgi:hypothetical protein